MFKNHPIKSYLVYSVVAALLYSIVAFIYIRSETFNLSWILYIGNVLFGSCIAAFVILYNKKRKENASTETMIAAGCITTVMGVILACVISLICFLVVSDVSHLLPQNDVLNNAPPQMESGKRHQFLLALFMNAIIGNVSTGSFISFILAYAAKRDQKGSTSTKTSHEPELLNENDA